MAETNDSHIKATDRELEARASGAMRELMQHRWHWTLDESNPERKAMREYARLVGRDIGAISRLARGYVLLTSDDQMINTPAEAYALAGLAPDKQVAVRAISELEGFGPGHIRNTRGPQVKAIAAEIADLPEAEKEAVARELAHDPGFMSGALAEQVAARSTTDSRPRPTPIEKAINTARLRLAIGKAEDAAQSVLDGVNRSDLDEDDIASLERSSHRARVLADYIDAVLGVGDMDKALEELLS